MKMIMMTQITKWVAKPIVQNHLIVKMRKRKNLKRKKKHRR